MDDVRQHGPEALPFPPLDLVEPEVPRPAFPARLIPLSEKGFLGAPGFAPADAVAHGRLTGRHRLTVQADQLPEASGDPGLRIRELDALRPNAARPTHNPPLGVGERHPMGRPRQVVPGPISTRPDLAAPSATAAAGVAAHAAPLKANHQAPARVGLHPDHSKPRQPQNPRTIASRSHPSSLVGCTSRENTIHSRMATVGSPCAVQAAEQTAHPNRGPRRRPGTAYESLYSNR